MAKLSVLSWIGNAAAVLFGKHGDITAQAQQAGGSRQAAYEHADRVQQAVAQAQQAGPTATNCSANFGICATSSRISNGSCVTSSGGRTTASSWAGTSSDGWPLPCTPWG